MRRLNLLIDLLLLAVSLGNAVELRAVVLVVAGAVGALVIFCAVVLTVGLWAQRTPPYPMQGPGGFHA